MTQTATTEPTGGTRPDMRAQQIVRLRNREREAQNTFRRLWQETADLMFPRENQITRADTPGTRKRHTVYDATAIRDSQEMVSGLSGSLIPAGQKFFGLKAADPTLAEIDIVQRYMQLAAERLHEEMFQSNFMLQFNETLRSLVVFGTGNLYTEWDAKRRALNYKDYDIAQYQILEDARGRVETVILTYHLTAQQAETEFGPENLGDAHSDEILKAASNPDTSQQRFEFIQIVRRRTERDTLRSDSLNMPFESIIVDVKHERVVREEGFDEFPFAVARWMRSSAEKYGRGQGTESLADVKMLQRAMKDFLDCANKWVNPPLEVSGGFDGVVNVTPGALNYTPQKGSIGAIDRGAYGNFPIAEKAIELLRDSVHKAFYRDVFQQLSLLTGDRRTTVEINARLREALRRLVSPIARLQSELLDPVITRSLKLLIRNGKIPYPPEPLDGKPFGVEYIGELPLRLREQQSAGLGRLAAFVGEYRDVAPGLADNIQWDRATRRLARAFGVNVNDLATEEEVQATRQTRAEAMEEQQEREAAQAAAQAYKGTREAPEAGSPAAELMGA